MPTDQNEQKKEAPPTAPPNKSRTIDIIYIGLAVAAILLAMYGYQQSQDTLTNCNDVWQTYTTDNCLCRTPTPTASLTPNNATTNNR